MAPGTPWSHFQKRAARRAASGHNHIGEHSKCRFHECPRDVAGGRAWSSREHGSHTNTEADGPRWNALVGIGESRPGRKSDITESQTPFSSCPSSPRRGGWLPWLQHSTAPAMEIGVWGVGFLPATEVRARELKLSRARPNPALSPPRRRVQQTVGTFVSIAKQSPSAE